MNTLAKLIFTLSIPVLAMCSTAQTQTYSQTQAAAAYAPEFSRAELDQMLAPIALYPDTVLSHILIASTYPLEIVQADRWARENRHLQAEDAVAAVEHQNWDPSVRALVAFPEILQRLSNDLEWTQRLGDAFLADEVAVMDVIQDLRQKAYASGSLRKMKHVSVHRDERIIIIEPAVERVVYIPYYDTRVVYGNWWWPDYPPTYWHHPHNHVYASGFYWSPRAYLGIGFFTTSFHWHQHRVVYIDHAHHHHRGYISRPYSSRKIAFYEGARHWRHNPVHRRGLAYHNDRVSERYGSHRPSTRRVQEERNYDRKFSDTHRSSRTSANNLSRDERARRQDTVARDRNPNDRAAAVRQGLSRDGATPARELPRALRTGDRDNNKSLERAQRRESNNGQVAASREHNATDRAATVRERLNRSNVTPAREASREARGDDRNKVERTRVETTNSRERTSNNVRTEQRQPNRAESFNARSEQRQQNRTESVNRSANQHQQPADYRREQPAQPRLQGLDRSDNRASQANVRSTRETVMPQRREEIRQAPVRSEPSHRQFESRPERSAQRESHRSGGSERMERR